MEVTGVDAVLGAAEAGVITGSDAISDGGGCSVGAAVTGADLVSVVAAEAGLGGGGGSDAASAAAIFFSFATCSFIRFIVTSRIA